MTVTVEVLANLVTELVGELDDSVSFMETLSEYEDAQGVKRREDKEKLSANAEKILEMLKEQSGGAINRESCENSWSKFREKHNDVFPLEQEMEMVIEVERSFSESWRICDSLERELADILEEHELKGYADTGYERKEGTLYSCKLEITIYDFNGKTEEEIKTIIEEGFKESSERL